MTNYNFKDLTGQRFTSLVILHRDTSKPKRTYWICRCDCGSEKSIRGEHITNGKIKSCGCKSSEMRSTHGDSKTSTYHTWQAMKDRCLNPKCKEYENYGGRGITVCDRWIESYENFKEDMGERPGNLTIDRIENNKGYCKENCRWATRKQQADNRRNVRMINIDGREMCLKDWCKEFNKSYSTVRYHLSRGKDLIDILKR